MKIKKENKIKILLFLLWMSILLIIFLIHKNLGIPFSEYPSLISSLVMDFGIYGALFLILISVIRPLIFFPATILTIITGALYGPFYGFIIMMIGENLSANLSFIIGRYFGGDLSEKYLTSKNKYLKNFDCRFRENTFLSVLFMRLLYFPFDMVGYFSGMCRANHLGFALGTFLGIIPGILTFIFLGSAALSWTNLIIAGFFFIFGLVLSKYLKKIKILEKL